MFDVLLCYTIMISTMKHSGHFVVVADMCRRAKAQCRAIYAAAPRKWRTTAATACGTLALPTDRTPVICRTQEDWVQRLTRLEIYVASIG
jgi:hypothetical protein